MFRFTIRDLLWLMVVVGLSVGWWLEHEHFASRARRDQLRERRQLLAKKYGDGDVTFLDLSRANIELDDAEIAAADTSEDRQLARQRKVKHQQELQQTLRRLGGLSQSPSRPASTPP
jgi:outer membrane protein TolC